MARGDEEAIVDELPRTGDPIAEQFRRSGPEGRRVGRRVPGAGLWLAWEPVRTGRVRRRRHGASEHAQVVDLSISGAQVEARADDDLVVGSVVTIGLDGASGQVRVRRLGPEQGGRRRYGVEFIVLDPALRDRIDSIMFGADESLEARWHHTPR